MNTTDGDNGGLHCHVDLPTWNGLQANHNLRSEHNRIDALPRKGAMGLPALHFDADGIAARHGRAGSIANLASGHAGNHMQAEDGRWARVLEHTLFDHQFGAALFVAGRTFLGGLEYELNRSWNLHFDARENFSDGH